MKETALVIGVGPGLGAALSRRFADAGMDVALCARNSLTLDRLVTEIKKTGGTALAIPADCTDEAQVKDLFARVHSEFGVPDLVVYNAGAFQRTSILDASAGEFEHCWKVGCFGGFLAGRESAKLMVGRGSGTVIFTGATASLRGSAQFFNLAVGKFGLRALAQSMARELGPRGIHVAHVVVDGQIAGPAHPVPEERQGMDTLMDPAAIAESIFQLHRQHRSAWTQELDLRPWAERF